VLYLEAREHAIERIEGLLTQIRALDMHAVRDEIEEQKRAEVALRMRRVCPTARRSPFLEARGGRGTLTNHIADLG